MPRRATPRVLFRLSFVASTALGCACGAPAAESPPPTSPATTTTPAASPPGSADYEVHEWGLLRAGDGDVLTLGAAAPPISFVPMAVEKPVLYFHASAPITLRSVVASITGGTIAEAWPLVPFGESVTWTDVRIDPTASCPPAPLPSATEAPCAALPAGESCETTSLAAVRTHEAACVTVGSASEGFLFYRGRVTRFTPPLRFERVPGSTTGEISVTNESDVEIPGVLVRIRSEMARSETLTAAPPGPHQSVIVGSDFAAQAGAEDLVETPMAEEIVVASTTAAGRAGIRRSAQALGLTDQEVAVFLSAWGDALFGRDGEMAERTPAPREAFVYFLPESLDDDVATLTFDPPPRTLRRALAVWSIVPATGPSH